MRKLQIFKELKKIYKKKIKNNSYKINKRISKLLAIPTTAGSGAEVTANAVIYIDLIKYSIEGKELKPDVHFLIPELIIRIQRNLSHLQVSMQFRKLWYL